MGPVKPINRSCISGTDCQCRLLRTSRGKPSVMEQPSGVSAAEAVIHNIHGLYTSADNGLLTIGQELGIVVEAPRPKVTVMLVGNHSAGKSSFINWYIGEYVQLESVAMETNSFTFVTSGKKRDTFKGRATIKHKPWLAQIESFAGAVDNLSTQISASRKNLFAMCDFIDTPGLTDGSLKYPYPVNEILEWLGERADLIFVFFDPHGQALCARTMNVVQRLNQTCKPKTHYFLTMADKIPSEKERSKVILQVAQSLSHAQTQLSPAIMSESDSQSKRETDHSSWADSETWLGEHALRVRPIFIPQKAQTADDHDFNRIDEALQLISDAVNQNVQSHIERLEVDSSRLLDALETRLRRHETRQRVNRITKSLHLALLLCGWTVPMLLTLYLLHIADGVLGPSAGWFIQHPWLYPLLPALKTLSSQFSSAMALADRWTMLTQLTVSFTIIIILAKATAMCFLSVMSPAASKKMYAWRAILKQIHEVEVQGQWKLLFSESTFD
ncbi:G domain-containing protein [Plasmodiophora brassicae]